MKDGRGFCCVLLPVHLQYNDSNRIFSKYLIYMYIFIITVKLIYVYFGISRVLDHTMPRSNGNENKRRVTQWNELNEFSIKWINYNIVWKDSNLIIWDWALHQDQIGGEHANIFRQYTYNRRNAFNLCKCSHSRKQKKMDVINCCQTRNETENHDNDWIVYRPRNQQREVLELCHAFKSNVSFLFFVIELHRPFYGCCAQWIMGLMTPRNIKKCRIIVLYGDVIMITSALICR